MSRQPDAPSNASAQGSLQLPLASLANVLASCVLQEAHAGLHSDLQKEGWRGGEAEPPWPWGSHTAPGA